MRVSDRFIIVLVSLIFSFVLKGNAFSNYFVRLALNNDHKLMKTSLNQTLRPFFSALSSNTFPGASHDNIGGGVSTSFVGLRLSRQEDRLTSATQSESFEDIVLPMFGAFVGIKLPFYGIRLWTRGGIIPEGLSGSLQKISFVGGGAGADYLLLSNKTPFSPTLTSQVTFHKLEGLPGLESALQIGLATNLSLKIQALIFSLKPYLSVGLLSTVASKIRIGKTQIT